MEKVNRKRGNKVMIGIDPGLTGAVAYVGSSIYSVYDIPVMAKGKGAGKVKYQVNPAELARVLRQIGKDKVFLERVSSMPGQGVASMFSMGDTFGCIRGVCAAMGYEVEIITPQSWKKHFKLGKDKEVVRAKAIELFPDVELPLKKHHNRAEALLIAQYGMQTN